LSLEVKIPSSRPFIVLLFLIALPTTLFGQTKLAITIDDVPNTRLFEANNYRSPLLEQIDSMQIPVAIFVNEGLIYKTEAVAKNKLLLADWVKHESTTLGNHTFSHARYSEVGYPVFLTDVENGENYLGELAETHQKELKYFRFPYNDLGKDSVQQCRMDSALHSKNYTSTPFTVESSDWMFNAVYENYLSHSEPEKAAEIGKLYVAKTIDYIRFFDSLSVELYGRSTGQIYLCHDNALNAAYLKDIVAILQQENVELVSLEAVLEDPIYAQKNTYYKKWGVSWYYRWMKTQSERVEWMKQEPDISMIEALFDELNQK